MKQLYILLLLFLCSCAQKFPDYIPFTAQFIYDESHNNVWRLWDHGYCGYSRLAMLLKQRGVVPSVNTKRLDTCLQATYAKAYQQTILMLSVAKYQEFDTNEIDAIHTFVQSGGLLFVVAEHDNMYKSSDFLNAVTKPLGIQINHDAVGTDSNLKTVADLNHRAYSKKFKLKNVMHMLSASLVNNKGSFEEVLNDSVTDAVIAAGCRVGKGKLLVVGDSEMFWNGEGTIGIGAACNEAFFLKCIEWLLEKNISHAVHQAVRTSWYDAENSIIAPDESVSGVKNFLEALKKAYPELIKNDSITIVVIPKPNATIHRDKRTILFIEPHQKLVHASVWGNRLLTLGAANKPVYSFLMSDSYPEVLPCFITDGDNNFYDVAISVNRKLLLFHTLAGLKSGADGMLLKIPDNLWGEANHPGLEVVNDGVPLFQQNDYTEIAFVYADKHLLIFGDADSVANQNSNTETFNTIVELVIRWIQHGRL